MMRRRRRGRRRRARAPISRPSPFRITTASPRSNCLRPRDAGRQQALAARAAPRPRRHRRSARPSARACPAIQRLRAVTRIWHARGTRCSRRRSASACSGLQHLAAGDDHLRAAGDGDLAASILVPMPPRDSSEPAPPAMASISGVMSRDLGRAVARRGRRRAARCRARRCRTAAPAVGAHHRGDARRQPVIVAVADFARRDRVVLVDDRHGAELEQRRRWWRAR